MLTFEELIEDCFSEIKRSIENEVEYKNGFESISEEIKANETLFTKDGKIFNY